MIFSDLRYEIEQVAPELKNEIYATNAPETSKKPYLVYYQDDLECEKTLDGYIRIWSITYIFSIMAVRQEDMGSISKKIQNMLMSIPGTRIGETLGTFVEDLTVHHVNQVYEHNLKINRGIIDFTIYFREEA